MSLEDAIARNRARQAAKKDAVLTGRHDAGLRAFTINVRVVPTILDMQLLGARVHDETRTIYGTSLADAKKRAGIE
jgi:hypothetical protein